VKFLSLKRFSQKLPFEEQGVPALRKWQPAQWIVRYQVANRQVVTHLLGSGLDRGESEAIVLATELPAKILILDERRARDIALQRNLSVTGTLGVLITAKQTGFVPAIKPLLDDLLAAGVYLDSRLIADALLLANE